MGMGTNAALAQTIIVGVINLSFTVLAIFTVDRFGRKPLMIIGSLGMAVSMVTLGLLGAAVRDFSQPDPRSGHGVGRCRAVGRQLRGVLDFPDDGQIELPDRAFPPRVRLLDLCADGVGLCVFYG